MNLYRHLASLFRRPVGSNAPRYVIPLRSWDVAARRLRSRGLIHLIREMPQWAPKACNRFFSAPEFTAPPAAYVQRALRELDFLVGCLAPRLGTREAIEEWLTTPRRDELNRHYLRILLGSARWPDDPQHFEAVLSRAFLPEWPHAWAVIERHGLVEHACQHLQPLPALIRTPGQSTTALKRWVAVYELDRRVAAYAALVQLWSVAGWTRKQMRARLQSRPSAAYVRSGRHWSVLQVLNNLRTCILVQQAERRVPLEVLWWTEVAHALASNPELNLETLWD